MLVGACRQLCERGFGSHGIHGLCCGILRVYSGSDGVHHRIIRILFGGVIWIVVNVTLCCEYLLCRGCECLHGMSCSNILFQCIVDLLPGPNWETIETAFKPAH